MNENILAQKNCFITGATGGIGKEITKQLASKKCNLFLTATNENRLKKLKTEKEQLIQKQKASRSTKNVK